MRALLFLSSLVFLASCADDSNTTAPANSRRSNNRSAAASNATVTQAVIGQGKPGGTVGFTTITTVRTTNTIPALSGASKSAICPAGTTVIAGGFDYGPFVIASPPITNGSGIVNNGWTVGVINETAGANDVSLTVFAYCAS
jgi:hypothetical protein